MGTPVIVEAVRTPIGKRGGWLAGLHAAELLGGAQRGHRAGRHRPRRSSNRSSAAASPRPASSPTTSSGTRGCTPACLPRRLHHHRRQCGSAQQAAHLVDGLIAAGRIEVGIACGVEAMSRVPLGRTSAGMGCRGPTPGPSTCPTSSPPPSASPHRGITRADVDAFGVARRSRRAGRRRGPVRPRGHRRRRPVLDDEGTPPARPASSTPTRACATPPSRGSRPQAGARRRHPHRRHLVADLRRRRRRAHHGRRRARALGLRPRARIVSQCLVGSDPYYHLDGPSRPPRRCSSTGMTIDDIDLFEVNEAFASVVLSWG